MTRWISPARICRTSRWSAGRAVVDPLYPSSSNRSLATYQPRQSIDRMKSAQSLRWISHDASAGSDSARLTDWRV